MASCPHCNCDLDPVKGRPRSVDQLRRFFAVLRGMYFNWPETCTFQPHSANHLRKWVLCMAGHGEIVQTLTVPGSDNPERLKVIMEFSERLLAMDDRFSRWKGATMAVYQAKSIAFRNMSPAAFNALNEEVEAVYLDETGIKADDVLKVRAA